MLFVDSYPRPRNSLFRGKMFSGGEVARRRNGRGEMGWTGNFRSLFFQEPPVSCLREGHLELVKRARDGSALLLEGFLKSEEIFLDIFEEEYELWRTDTI